MSAALESFEHLLHEHQILLGEYGRVQARCSELLRGQVAEIERLNAELVRLRAAVIVRDSAQAWVGLQPLQIQAVVPNNNSPHEQQLVAQRIASLLARVYAMTSAHLPWSRPAAGAQPLLVQKHLSGLQESTPDAAGDTHREELVGPGALEASLRAADLVICQTGCLSHGDYWRVQDHCKRTGKACVLVAQPETLRIVHIHQSMV